MIIENKAFLDGQIAHPGYFLVVYYKYEYPYRETLKMRYMDSHGS